MSQSLPSPSDCGFCKGRPVGNAAKWIGGAGPDMLPCPRCGETNLPQHTEKDRGQPVASQHTADRLQRPAMAAPVHSDCLTEGRC